MAQDDETIQEHYLWDACHEQSVRYLDRDLSWLRFNERVLDQVKRQEQDISSWLKFLCISAANLDEFFVVNEGRLHNHARNKQRSCVTREPDVIPLHPKLLDIARSSFQKQHAYFLEKIHGLCAANHFALIQDLTAVSVHEQHQLEGYFKQTILPALTPTTWDCAHHILPALGNGILTFGAVMHDPADRAAKKIYFVSLPKQLARFYHFKRGHNTMLVPVERIIQQHLSSLFQDVVIVSVTLFRVIRGVAMEASDDLQVSLMAKIKRRLKRRNKGSVVRLDVACRHDPWLVAQMRRIWELEVDSVFQVPEKSLIDLAGLQQLVPYRPVNKSRAVLPIAYPYRHGRHLFEVLKQQDILLHHPYNSMDLVLELLDQAAADPQVSAIKITIYRLAKDSAIIAALLKAVKHGKQVVVVIEIKARLDEENNMRAATQLKQAGCSVVYGVRGMKVHTKMMLIVRKEQEYTYRYVHVSSGNYNEETAREYVDIGLMTTDATYANDVSACFDAIMSHTAPQQHQNSIMAPHNMRQQLTTMMRQEAQHAQRGLPCGIVIKVNALDDQATIEALYQAAQAGVPIRLVVRSVCCLLPQKEGLSTNISVRSIVGDFLEHARIFYFHNQGNPNVYMGSADIMTRSFDRRIETLWLLKNPLVRQQAINILAYNLRDNVNSYVMQSDGTYTKVIPDQDPPFNMHCAFFKVTWDEVMQARLFS